VPCRGSRGSVRADMRRKVPVFVPRGCDRPYRHKESEITRGESWHPFWQARVHGGRRFSGGFSSPFWASYSV
jgi:hypothetical protein